MKFLLLIILQLICFKNVFGAENNSLLIHSNKVFENKNIDDEIEQLKKEINNTNTVFGFSEWAFKKRLLSFAYLNKEFYNLAISHLLDVYNHRQIHFFLNHKILIHLELGNVLKINEEYDRALSHFLSASKLLTNSKDYQLKIEADLLIGEFYRKIGEYKSAETAIKSTLKLAKSDLKNNQESYYNALNRLAAIFTETNRLDSSILLSFEVIEYAYQQNNLSLAASSHNEIGFCHMNKLNYDSSKHHFTLADSLWTSINELKYAAHAKNNLGISLARSNEPDSLAIICLKNVITFVKKNQLNYPLFEVYNYLRTEYLHNLAYDSAFKYSELYFEELRNFDIKSANVKIYEIKENFQNEQLTFNLKIANNNLLEEKNTAKSRRFLLLISIVFTSILFLLILVLYRLYFKSKKSEKELSIKNNEQEILIKEINHRVKNNMQMVSSILSLQAGKSNNELAKNSLKIASDRINSLALAHQKIYQNEDYSNIVLEDYIRLLIESLIKFTDVKMDVKMDVEIDSKLVFEIEKAQSIGFILNELITNSLKHAWAEDFIGSKVIIIKLQGDEKKGTLNFSDNGMGLQIEKPKEKMNSIGFMLIESFVNRQLKGDFNFFNSSGLHIKINYDFDKDNNDSRR